jgi:predicted phage-related endonuclease
MVGGEDSAVEVKCLNSASHIEAYLTQEVPKEYEFQILQYFIVNEKLQKVYMVFYDPDLSVKQFFFIEITRESVQEDIDKYLEYQMQTLAEVNEIVTRLSF